MAAHDDKEIASLRARLNELEAERGTLSERLDRLQLQATTGSVLNTASASVTGESRAAEKIALFRRLFAGRTDVFPLRWENRNTGKSGYAPACANEWVRGVCGKLQVKCGDCPNQAFLVVSDQVIAKHLRGVDDDRSVGAGFVAGVYPILMDGSCRFVAADFDGENWSADALAYLETCRVRAVPAALERSRSGEGGRGRFERFTRNLVVLHGGLKSGERRAAQAGLQAGRNEERLVLATGRYLGEGFDDSRLDTLFLVMPVSWKGTLAQYVGRLHRDHDGKREVIVYDYVDRAVPVLARMAIKREKGYRTLGYVVDSR